MEGDRPAKRIKTHRTKTTPLHHDSPKTSMVGSTHGAMQAGASEAQYDGPRKHASKYRKQGQRPPRGAQPKSRPNSLRTFTQPSAISPGDKGIFVTCDKGCEKKALLELLDILQEYLESKGINASGEVVQDESDQTRGAGDTSDESIKDGPRGIEADIASELEEMRAQGQADVGTMSSVTSKPVQMITLDIACVSFVRLPAKSSIDPVDLVHRICLEAAKPGSKQRSRFIKRLTPISNLAKTLRQGLETVSEEVLTPHFGPDEAGHIRSVKFAIRPTVRENEQLDRDLIIKPVADRVQELGEGCHKVDLKHYDKAVIVEVYRGWVGMSVVDNTDTNGYEQGYEQLRRFNLAEIYVRRPTQE